MPSVMPSVMPLMWMLMLMRECRCFNSTSQLLIFFSSSSQGILIEILEGQGHFASVVGVSSGEGGDLSEHDPSEHVAQVYTEEVLPIYSTAALLPICCTIRLCMPTKAVGTEKRDAIHESGCTLFFGVLQLASEQEPRKAACASGGPVDVTAVDD